MPLPLTVSCFSKIKIGFTFLIPAHPGSPGKWSLKRVCVCVCVCIYVSVYRPNCLFGRIGHKSLINALSADESTFTKLSVILAASLTMVTVTVLILSDGQSQLNQAADVPGSKCSMTPRSQPISTIFDIYDHAVITSRPNSAIASVTRVYRYTLITSITSGVQL